MCACVYAVCTHCATCPIQNGDEFCLHSNAKNIVRKQKQSKECKEEEEADTIAP